ncbi:MAG: hypothetical protein ACRD9L_27620 [Bryobacteraceae bacterium]
MLFIAVLSILAILFSAPVYSNEVCEAGQQFSWLSPAIGKFQTIGDRMVTIVRAKKLYSKFLGVASVAIIPSRGLLRAGAG